jgi:ABC-2 type transport system ATP-binding protein
VRGIQARGKTVVLTTHLMEEAERLCDRVAIIDHGRIVDMGRPGDLVRRHCPGRTVIVTTDDPTASARFRALPRVLSVEEDERQLRVQGREDEFVMDLIQCVADARIRVSDFRTETPTLEDVFLTVTGHSVRE